MKAPRIDMFIITLFLLMSTGCGGLAIIWPFVMDTRGTRGYLLASGTCVNEFPPDDEYIYSSWCDVSDARGLAFDALQMEGINLDSGVLLLIMLCVELNG